MRRQLERFGLAVLTIVALALALAKTADAHQTNVSLGVIVDEQNRNYHVAVSMKATDLARILGETVARKTAGITDLAKIADIVRQEAGAFMLAHIDIEGASGPPCAGKTGEVLPDSVDGIRVVTLWDCGKVPGNLVYRAGALLEAIGAQAKEFVFIGESPDAPQVLLSATRPTLDISAASRSALEVAVEFFQHGVEHILTGYDHICFLLAVILWANKFWPVVKVVTAFTIAHSITLSLAALGIVALPSALTEAAIAASIVYVAVENFFSRNFAKRWHDTFLFGLVHGFGFASGLLEIGVPQHAVAPALASFNIGVETGQIAIVLVVVPLLVLSDRLSRGERSKKLVYAASGIIALLGGYWFLMRTVFL